MNYLQRSVILSNSTNIQVIITPKSDYRSEEADGLRDKVQALTSEVATLKIQLNTTERSVKYVTGSTKINHVSSNYTELYFR